MRKLKAAVLLLSSTILLTGCENVPVPEIKLIPSWLSFVVQIFALIILLVVVFVLAYKPVKKYLKKRSDYIEENIRESERNRAIAAQNEVQSSEALLASKIKANEIIEEANASALKSSENIIAEAKEEANKIKQDAQVDIEKSKQEALESIHDEMVNVALSASSEILKREVNEDDNKRLAKEFIEKL